MRRTAAALLALLLAACGEGPGPAAPPVDPGVKIHPDAVVMDSTARLVSSGAERQAGRLEFLGASRAPSPGQVLAGSQDGGFLRRVVRTHRAGDTLVVETTPATLGEAIVEGRIEERVSLAPPAAADTHSPGPGASLLRLADGMRATGDGFVVENVSLKRNNIEVQILQGTIRYTPEALLSGDIEGSQVRFFGLDVQGALDADLKLKVTATASGKALEVADTIAGWKKLKCTRLGYVPVCATFTVHLVMQLSSEIAGETSAFANAQAHTPVTLRAGIRDGALTGDFQLSPTAQGGITGWSARIDATTRLTLRPVVGVELYTVPVLSGEVGPYVQKKSSLTVQDNRRIRSLAVGFDGKVASEPTILGVTLLKKEWSWDGPSWVVWADTTQDNGPIGPLPTGSSFNATAGGFLFQGTTQAGISTSLGAPFWQRHDIQMRSESHDVTLYFDPQVFGLGGSKPWFPPPGQYVIREWTGTQLPPSVAAVFADRAHPSSGNVVRSGTITLSVSDDKRVAGTVEAVLADGRTLRAAFSVDPIFANGRV